MANVSLICLGCTAVFFPLFGLLFAIVWTILFNLEESVRTVCHVANYIPTVSSATGGFTPQSYVWRITIALQVGLRFTLAYCYYHWHLRVHLGPSHMIYQLIVRIAIFCHVAENFALVTIASVSSTENAVIHENSFIVFMVCSELYMLLSCALIQWSHRAGVFKVTTLEKKHLGYKVFLFVFNLTVFFVSIYFYFRHNAFCEPYIYSYFALAEYVTILSNIAFHGMCIVDFRDYTFTFHPSEDFRTGYLKDS